MIVLEYIYIWFKPLHRCLLLHPTSRLHTTWFNPTVGLILFRFKPSALCHSHMFKPIALWYTTPIDHSNIQSVHFDIKWECDRGMYSQRLDVQMDIYLQWFFAKGTDVSVSAYLCRTDSAGSHLKAFTGQGSNQNEASVGCAGELLEFLASEEGIQWMSNHEMYRHYVYHSEA